MSNPPQLAVYCPWCLAPKGQRCATKGKGRALRSPIHPARLAWWAVSTSVCPTCQVEIGISCRNGDGQPTGAHPQREAEAVKAAAGMGHVTPTGRLGAARRAIADGQGSQDR